MVSGGAVLVVACGRHEHAIFCDYAENRVLPGSERISRVPVRVYRGRAVPYAPWSERAQRGGRLRRLGARLQVRQSREFCICVRVREGEARVLW